MVVEDPEIRGGEPCIRGTRVGVYEIARMLEHGAPEDEILEGYPSLKREQLELAKIYVGAYPRKRRPPHRCSMSSIFAVRVDSSKNVTLTFSDNRLFPD